MWLRTFFYIEVYAKPREKLFEFKKFLFLQLKVKEALKEVIICLILNNNVFSSKSLQNNFFDTVSLIYKKIDSDRALPKI